MTIDDPSSDGGITGTVKAGAHGLEFSPGQETFALFEAELEETNAAALEEALSRSENEDRAEPFARVEEATDDASTITSRCERCVRLFNDLASGKELDPNVLSEEIDAALSLFARLDKSGRHKEALRVARELAALLALVLRWLELTRSLRRALEFAHSLGDHDAEAWALNELGVLYLSAGESEKASELLGRAARIKDEVHLPGRCTTRHNLDAAQRDIATYALTRQLRRRRLFRLGAGGTAVVILAMASVALGFHGHHGRPPTGSTGQTTSDTGTTGTTTGTTSTTGTGTTGTSTTGMGTTNTSTTGTSTTGTGTTGTGTTGTSTTGTGTSGTGGGTSTGNPTPIDDTPPNLVVDSPVADIVITTSQPTISGQVGVARGDLPSVALHLYLGTSTDPSLELPGQRVTPKDGSFTVPWSRPLGDGTYTLVAVQLDRTGNRAHPQITFTLDATAPTVFLTEPKQGESINTVTPTFSGTAGTASTDLPVSISIYAGRQASGTPVQLTADVDQSTGHWSRTANPLDGYTYTAVVTQSDQAGHRSNPQTVTFKLAPNG